jgi:hypothetical protein
MHQFLSQKWGAGGMGSAMSVAIFQPSDVCTPFDPLSYLAVHAFGTVRMRDGRFNEAAPHYARAVQANPRCSLMYAIHAAALAQGGRMDDAKSVAISSWRSTRTSPSGLSTRHSHRSFIAS